MNNITKVGFGKMLCKELGLIDANVDTVLKQNFGSRTAIMIPVEIVGDKKIGMNVYIDDYYENYLNGRTTIEEVLECIKDIIEEFENSGDYNKISEELEILYDFEKVKGQLFIKVMDTKRNLNLLDTLIHENFLNLSIVPYIKMGTEMTINVNQKIQKCWNIEEKEILSIATKNTFKESNIDFVSFTEMLGIPSFGPEMYVLSNKDKFFGASMITSREILLSVAKKLNSNFYIFPSSVHECIILKESSDSDSTEYLKMVEDINESVVDGSDFLSDAVYYYDLLEEKIILKEIC